jgi:DNA (cytosine-5)-methyltransferase 1
MKKPIAIDLFSGCGGLTLGLKQAGFRVIGAVENDNLAVETYKENHKKVYVWHTDIQSLSVSEVKRLLKIKKGELDLLAGCPPCQGFSSMTTLNGKRRVRDPRNNLVFEFVRFARGLMPKAIMMENVPGLARNKRIKKVKRELEQMGYECDFKVFNAADFGVPQRRRRIILLAGRRDLVPFALPARVRRTVRQAFRKLGVRARKGPLHRLHERHSPKVLSLIRMIPKNGGSRLDLGKDRQLACHRKCDGFKDIYGRMAWDDVAPTITSGCVNPSKGRFLHPVRNRAITLREAALLQSFPPSYFFSLRRGKGSVAEMIGNALPPEFIRRHANSVIRFLIQKRTAKGKSIGKNHAKHQRTAA